MNILSVVFASLCFLATAALGAAATPPVNLLAPGQWYFGTPHPEDASQQTITDVSAPGGETVTQITVVNPSNPLWLIQTSCDIPADIPAGDVLVFHFWARSPTSNPVRVTLEENVSPYQSIAVTTITLQPRWQEFAIQGQSTGQHELGLSAHVQVGQQAGTIELTGLTVTDTGRDPSLASAESAILPAQIDARIERYRKGLLTIKVVDSAGKPIPGMTVKVAQTRHAFLFGCNCFMLNPADSSPTQIAYQTDFMSLFNYATLPFYWGAFEPQQGQPAYARLDAMADWCDAHNITIKGHPLVWHQVWPAWAPQDADAAIPLLKARVYGLIGHYKSRIHYWDVVNEANGAAEIAIPNGESEWIKRDGPAAVVGTALGWARNAAGESGPGHPETFIYNDYNIDDANVALLTSLKSAGKLPDAVGIQSHMHSGNWPLTKVWQVCQTFGQFGVPIHFTETTVLSGPQRAFSMDGPALTDWITTPEDEEKQADYVVQFYSLLFSHPAVRAITWWDLSDLNSWLGAPSGLVRKDMSAKPAYTRLMNLIHHKWWTRTEGVTGHFGSFAARVFYGDYQVTVTDPTGKSRVTEVAFPEAAPPLEVVVRRP